MRYICTINSSRLLQNGSGGGTAARKLRPHVSVPPPREAVHRRTWQRRTQPRLLAAVHLLRAVPRRRVRTETQSSVLDEQQEASVPGSVEGRPERAKTKSAWVFGPQWVNE